MRSRARSRPRIAPRSGSRTTAISRSHPRPCASAGSGHSCVCVTRGAACMEHASLEHLRDEARHAYERGRLRSALFGVWPVVALAIVLIAIGMRPWFLVGVAGLHAVVVVALLHRGRAAGRAVTTGWLAGTLPL